MKWVKKGNIYCPDNAFDWSVSHAQVPIADYDSHDDVIKVYFSTRDEKGRSRPGFVVLDGNDPLSVLEIGSSPILGLGRLGTFDDCGVMPSWIVNRPNGEKWLYYIGWNVRNTISYHNSVGLAISSDGGQTYNRFSEGPLWDRNHIEPHYSGTSCVIHDQGIWKNWYLSCVEWLIVDNKPEPRYHIKYAESSDGINWNREGTVAIDFQDGKEGGIVKASVLVEDGIYKMWYAFRKLNDYRISKNASYRIGYAESNDGRSWSRLDQNKNMTLDISKRGWDSEMVAYPHVIDVKGQQIMFYNGNGFGRSGFGWAVQQ